MLLRLSFARTLARDPRPALVRRVFRGLDARGAVRGSESIAELAVAVYEYLKARGGNAYTCACAYFELLDRELGDSILYASPEMYCRDVFADYGVVSTGRLRLVEIKSARDSFVRFTDQLRGYRVAGTEIDVVLDSKHADNAEFHVPQDVGLILTDAGSVHRVRTPSHGGAHWTPVGLTSHVAFYMEGFRRVMRDVEARLGPSLGQGVAARSGLPDVHQLPPFAVHDAVLAFLVDRAPEFPLVRRRCELPGALLPIALSLRTSERQAEAILQAFDRPIPASWLNQRAG